MCVERVVDAKYVLSYTTGKNADEGLIITGRDMTSTTETMTITAIEMSRDTRGYHVAQPSLLATMTMGDPIQFWCIQNKHPIIWNREKESYRILTDMPFMLPQLADMTDNLDNEELFRRV